MGFDLNSAEAFNSESTQNTSSPEQGPVAVPEQKGGDTPTSAEQAILDLASVERFKFNDRVMTPKELQSAMLMQSDYTKKTQAIADERKFVSNIASDLAAIANDPSLLAEFKKIYPEQYWAIADNVLQRVQATQSTAQPQQASPQGQLSPEYQRALDRLEKLEKAFDPLQKDWSTREMKAVDAEIDATYSKFLGKYPHADQEKVTVWAQIINKSGTPLTNENWDRLFKKSHEDAVALSDKIYAEKAKNQKTNSQKAFAGSPGGATPGSAPIIPKSVKEATRLMMESGALEQ